jgi:protoporphyrinogen oxidase
MTSAQATKTAIVGAGIAGLAAAYDLLDVGHQVVIYEASDHTGGLAAGFRDDRWEWPLEKFYHHLFQSDKSIIQLVDEIGMREKLFFPRPITSMYYQGRIYPFDSPLRILRYPGLSLPGFIRFGLVTAFLRYTPVWQWLEQYRADEWMQRWYGRKVYQATWRPALINKFGPYYQRVNMAWMWARLAARSFRLGYFEGGFQAFIDRLTEVITAKGGQICLNRPVRRIEPLADGRLAMDLGQEQGVFDQALVTTSPGLLQRMAPALPAGYLGQLANLKSLGAVVMTLALKRPLMQESQTYWLNIPASSPDKDQNEIPFLALVEHTNYIDRRHYGGDHLIYCGDYVLPDHRYFAMSQEELQALFVGHLARFNPNFRPEWVRKSWLFRAGYAQPVPEVNHSQNIPDLRTPIPNLFFASMSQVYPWDRGTNFAVEIGRKVANLMSNNKESSA